MRSELWIFGYGSLVWRPAFPYQEREPGFVIGWQRRFWQASPDHRGTPEAPGRVVTLLEAADAICWGMGYRVADADADTVLARLDHREKAGYRRFEVDLYLRDRSAPVPNALVYVAGPDNPSFVGERPAAEIAEVIARSVGPSGPNRDYLLALHDALVEMGGRDDHIAELAELVVARGAKE